ncbi:MAG: transposase [Planctomycetia bacterium]
MTADGMLAGLVFKGAMDGAAGASIAWLPAYSPDLNPIEKAWSKIKTEARTTEGVKTAATTAWRNVTPADCRSYVTSCGYDSN